jgi:hypothetical protein
MIVEGIPGVPLILEGLPFVWMSNIVSCSSLFFVCVLKVLAVSLCVGTVTTMDDDELPQALGYGRLMGVTCNRLSSHDNKVSAKSERRGALTLLEARRHADRG